MKYRNIPVDKFLSSSFLATSLFITSGCHKTYKDYKNAPKEYKDDFLVKDSLILSGAALGMLSYQVCSNKIAKSQKSIQLFEKTLRRLDNSALNEKLKSSILYTTDIIKDLTSGVMSSASGIIAALGLDFLYTKCNPEELEYKPKIDSQNRMTKFVDKNLSKVADKDTRHALYTSVSDMPVISSGMLGANAIEIARDREFHKRLQHTTGYLINDTLVPLIFLSVSGALTRSMRPIYRIPTVFISLFAGTLGLRKCIDKALDIKKTI